MLLRYLRVSINNYLINSIEINLGVILMGFEADCGIWNFLFQVKSERLSKDGTRKSD